MSNNEMNIANPPEWSQVERTNRRPVHTITTATLPPVQVHTTEAVSEAPVDSQRG